MTAAELEKFISFLETMSGPTPALKNLIEQKKVELENKLLPGKRARKEATT